MLSITEQEQMMSQTTEKQYGTEDVATTHTGEKTKTRWSCILNKQIDIVPEVSPQYVTSTLPVVTPAEGSRDTSISASTLPCKTDPVTLPVTTAPQQLTTAQHGTSHATSITLPMATSTNTTVSADEKSLPVVMPMDMSLTMGMDTLPVVTESILSTAHTISQTVTTQDTSASLMLSSEQPIPMATQQEVSSSLNILPVVTSHSANITNIDPLPVVTPDLTDVIPPEASVKTIVSTALPVVTESANKITRSATMDPPISTSNMDMPSWTNRYGIIPQYTEVMNVEGDDVLHIHTQDILSNKCCVPLE